MNRSSSSSLSSLYYYCRRHRVLSNSTIRRKLLLSFQQQHRLVVLQSPTTTTTATCATTTTTASSSQQPKLQIDPSKLIQGLTIEQVENNPSIEEYIRSNYPEAFQEKQQQDDVSSGVVVDDENNTSSSSSYSRHVKPIYPLNIRPLTCYKRNSQTEMGSRKCRNIRQFAKTIPGIVYGSDPFKGIDNSFENKILIKTPWNFIQAELERYHRNFECRVYDLTVFEEDDEDDQDAENGGQVHRVIPRDVQRHPIQNSVYCVNFVRYHAGRPIKIPIEYINQEESDALKRDGFILPLQRHVECFVDQGVDIPEQIELECTGLKFKEVLRTDRLILPDGVRFSDRVVTKGNEYIVGVVFGKGRGDVDDEDDDDLLLGTEGGEAGGGAGGVDSSGSGETSDEQAATA